MNLLEIENLVTRQVGPVNLDLDTGNCVCLSGSSGTGKSLLLRAIADLDPHEGRLRLEGRDCSEYPPTEWRSRVGLLPAESQWWATTPAEHMDLEKITPGWLQRLGLAEDIYSRPVAYLSSGERQRLALLRLLINRPRVLLLDEPTASLDTGSTRAMEALIAEYCREEGAAVIWVSHQPDQISRVADRHYVLENSRLRETAP